MIAAIMRKLLSFSLFAGCPNLFKQCFHCHLPLIAIFKIRLYKVSKSLAFWLGNLPDFIQHKIIMCMRLKLKFWLSAALILLYSVVCAQSITVKGKVSSKAGVPLEGATVSVKGENIS